MCWRYRKIYAIVETGGKQYRVTPGQSIDIDSLGVAAGQPVELDRVLLIDDAGKVTTGSPVIEGARVLATSEGELRGDKITVLKYKPKVRYRRKKGHRQEYTRLTINDIATGGSPTRTKKRTTKKEDTEDGS